MKTVFCCHYCFIIILMAASFKPFSKIAFPLSFHSCLPPVVPINSALQNRPKHKINRSIIFMSFQFKEGARLRLNHTCCMYCFVFFHEMARLKKQTEAVIYSNWHLKFVFLPRENCNNCFTGPCLCHWQVLLLVHTPCEVARCTASRCGQFYNWKWFSHRDKKPYFNAELTSRH